MRLRKGRTKAILESSIDSALLAVEVYNKPRTTFRSECFITLMTIAWTRLFHAFFYSTIGDKFYYKEKNGRYKTVDGEKKAWELGTCIKNFEGLPKAVEDNLSFFIRLRNKIEHRHIEKREVDVLIFGECQACLFNYESLLIKLFGTEYAINEALVYSLQFSQIRNKHQIKANKSALGAELGDIVAFVHKYRNGLDEAVYNSQEYSIKLIQIPKISNTNRSDIAIEFVNLNSLSKEDQKAYEKFSALIKDKAIKVEAANVRRLKPTAVVNEVNNKLPYKLLNINFHTLLYKAFAVRPDKSASNPFNTSSEFCLYDETHDDYVYLEAWVDLLVNFLQVKKMTPKQVREMLKNRQTLSVKDFSIKQ